MVSLDIVQASNSLITSTFPPGIVAVFVGATSGIGEVTLKKFAEYTRQPRVYIIGRSQNAANRIMAECKALNSDGKYTFIKADVSLIHGVDEVCQKIKLKEEYINLLFLSAGVPSLDRSVTSEGLHLLAALNYYCRVRFMTNLLPLIQHASGLRRIVTVGGGGQEGPIDDTDFPALHVPFTRFRGHLCTLVTLGVEAVARTAPQVSFIHDYPGTVYTPFMNRIEGWKGTILRTYAYLFGNWVCVPVEESGQRHLYLATSGMYPPAESGSTTITLEREGEVEVARGTNGQIGSGMYSIGKYCESASPAVLNLLAGLRNNGMVDKVWEHYSSEIRRIMK